MLRPRVRPTPRRGGTARRQWRTSSSGSCRLRTERSAQIPNGRFARTSASTRRGAPSTECGRCRRARRRWRRSSTAMAAAKAPATVRRYVTSIAIAHRAIGCETTLEGPVVQLALKRMHRSRGRRQGQAKGLTWPLRERLLEAAGGRLIDARDRALLAVAYDAMLRRTELVSLQVEDLLEEMQGHGTLLVRRSKTDADGQGATLYIAPDTGCARARLALSAHVSRAGGCFAPLPRAGASASGSTRARSRASSRRWHAKPDCRRRWSRGCRGTARGSGPRRTWSRSASSFRPSSRRGAGSRAPW